jgi:hypothetical protein
MRFLQQAYQSPITEPSKWLNSVYEYIDQRWLQPIIDFSIPPNQIYERVSAKDFLSPEFRLKSDSTLIQPVILIAPGAYEEAGIKKPGADNFPVPAAVQYWKTQQGLNPNAPEHQFFTGGEFHAYLVHHLLAQRLVVPIPDLWMLLLAALVSKAISLRLNSRSLQQQRRWLVGLGLSSLAYGVVSLQLYGLYAVLLPWVLPSMVSWLYVAPTLRKQLYG